MELPHDEQSLSNQSSVNRRQCDSSAIQQNLSQSLTVVIGALNQMIVVLSEWRAIANRSNPGKLSPVHFGEFANHPKLNPKALTVVPEYSPKKIPRAVLG